MADPYTFDPRSVRYRHGQSGRYVPRDAVHDAVRQACDSGGVALADLGRQLQAGTIDLPTFQERFAAQLKAAHLATALVAVGGKANLTAKISQRVGIAGCSALSWA